MSEQAIEEQPCEVGSGRGFVAWNKVGGASQAVANDKDRVVTVRFGEFDDEIH